MVSNDTNHPWFQFIGSTRGGGWSFDRKNRRPLMRPAVETDRKTLHNGRKPSIIPDVVIQDDSMRYIRII
jgi:hypothetical protein